MLNASHHGQTLPTRLWLYQKERFPWLAHGILIFVLASWGVSLSALLSNDLSQLSTTGLGVAFLVLFTLFFQLRVADEYKDAENDKTYRSDRPVPRGLISLRELGWIAVGFAALQLAAICLLDSMLFLVLLSVWFYGALMTVEFGAAKWLHARPAIYLLSHMVIMPLIACFATACAWLVNDAPIPDGIGWGLLLAFSNGIMLELGRKTWAAEDDREGVESYSATWGIKTSLMVWLAALLVATFSVIQILFAMDFSLLPIGLVFAGAILVGIDGLQMYWKPKPRYAKNLENKSAVWLLFSYLSTGLIPYFWKQWF